MLARRMHVLNGCCLLPTHTCATTQKDQAVAHTTVDYAILNDTALQLAKGLAIEDHPPRRTAKNFHAHLALMLTCQQDLLEMTEVAGALGCHI